MIYNKLECLHTCIPTKNGTLCKTQDSKSEKINSKNNCSLLKLYYFFK